MLILTRYKEEEILIGNDVIIKVLGVHRGQVRLGFTAPKDVIIHRREVYEAIKRGETKPKKCTDEG